MTENSDTSQKRIWDEAWAWVQQQHGRELSDLIEQTEFLAWLAADPAHRDAYNKASQLWLLTGLVPPTHPIDNPDD